MPTQQRGRCHHEPMPAPMRKQTSKRSDKRTVGGPKLRRLMLARQDRQLVAQQHEFHVLGELGPSTPNKQLQDSSEGKVSEREQHRPILPGRATIPRVGRACAAQRLLVNARARELSKACQRAEPRRKQTRTVRARRELTTLPELRTRNRVLTPFRASWSTTSRPRRRSSSSSDSSCRARGRSRAVGWTAWWGSRAFGRRSRWWKRRTATDGSS